METPKSEQWIEDIFSSMEGSSKAYPDHNLYGEIEERLQHAQAPVIAMIHLKYAISAACIILLLNIFTLRQISQSNNDSEFETNSYSENVTHLFSDFNLYE